MRYQTVGWFVCGFALTLGGAAVLDKARAQSFMPRSTAVGPVKGQVVAKSRYGNTKVRGLVRPTSLGPQVQLPGGSWVYCKRSCAETLRAETVDFWEARQGPGGQEQGLLYYLRRW